MKRNTLNLVALGAVLLTAGFALGQSQAAKAPAPAPKQQKLLKVATLSTVQENQQFQSNVQMLQAQRQAAVDLNAAVEKEKDAKKKQELKTQLDALMTKLNENNAAMQKFYGFSLTRNYTIEVEKSNVYLLLTEEEAAKLEQSQKAEQAQKAKK
jgi:ABC-type Na+ efflux pump permease subunit